MTHHGYNLNDMYDPEPDAPDYYGDAIFDLFDSTMQFLKRFYPALPPMDTQLVACNEEIDEFLDAVQKGSEEEATKEFVDLMVTGMAMLAIRGVKPEKITDAVYLVIAKNDAKDNTTHYVSPDGKIDRIGRER